MFADIWDGLVETTGEIVGGAVDVVSDVSQTWVKDMLGANEQATVTASPDKMRKYQNTAQDADGSPLPQGGAMRPLNIDPMWLVGGAVILVGAVFLATRGGK
ncbi:hypothetical protein [Vibrio nigripulchritudo]|uniref:hypothetical protein n=1 Tax=Vibrio nigripulchritudo TaxID=28173 RepID=UPI00249309A1|nr:hypothetical protein [Vibrio nigripulchritudo]BDU42892.1 hypothetical protein TUMSATVNIG3_16900 [Vibrio nigripulchritudo]